MLLYGATSRKIRSTCLAAEPALPLGQKRLSLIIMMLRTRAGTINVQKLFTHRVSIPQASTISTLLTNSSSARIAYGAHADAPEIQGGFWVGGYRNNLTSENIFEDHNIYAKGLLIFNSTTLQTRNLTDVPFGDTQYGALHYLPSTINTGALVYLGGEQPRNGDTPQSASDYTYDVTTLDKVWVFDVANEVWYQQETTGEIPPPRTEFCSVKMADPSRNGAYQIYIMGGADFTTKAMQTDV